MIRYEFQVRTATGRPLGVLDQRGPWTATKVVNAPGALPLTLPLGRYPLNWFRQDNQILIWRSVDGGLPQLYADTIWLIKQVEIGEDAGVISLDATDGIGLLEKSRVILANTSALAIAAKKLNPFDDVMKAFVREHVGSLAPADRQFPAALFSVDADISKAPSGNVDGTERQLYDVLKDAAAQSLTAGTYLAFDVVYAAGQGLQFQTYTEQRGQDRRAGNFRLGQAYGNLSGATLTLDWRTQANVIYAASQGESNEDRFYATAIDTDRATRTPWSRHEVFLNASQAKTQTDVDTAANAELSAAGRLPRMFFAGTFVDTPGLRYGRDLTFGDRVKVQVLGRDVECRLDAVTIGETDRGEHICDIALRGEGEFDV